MRRLFGCLTFLSILGALFLVLLIREPGLNALPRPFQPSSPTRETPTVPGVDVGYGATPSPDHQPTHVAALPTSRPSPTGAARRFALLLL